MRKLWLSAGLILLVGMLGACSSKKSNLGQDQLEGYATCSGTYGQFEVGVIKGSQNGYYKVLFSPMQVSSASPVQQIALATPVSDVDIVHELVKPQIVFEAGRVYELGTFYIDDFDTYHYVVIVPYDSTKTFLEAFRDFNQFSAICELPYPSGSPGNY